MNVWANRLLKDSLSDRVTHPLRMQGFSVQHSPRPRSLKQSDHMQFRLREKGLGQVKGLEVSMFGSSKASVWASGKCFSHPLY